MSRDIIQVMMPIRSFLRLAAIVTFLLGMGLMLFPAPILTYFAEGQMPNDVHFVRFLGTALIGFGALNWASSNLSEPRALMPALYANATSLLLGVLIDVIGLVAGRLNQRAWLILALHVVFGAGFAYYLNKFRKAVSNSAHS